MNETNTAAEMRAELDRLRSELDRLRATGAAGPGGDRGAEPSQVADHFRALAENSCDVIMRFDRQYRHLYVNPVVESQTGIAPKDFIGRTHAEIGFPAHLVRVWEEALEKVFVSGQANRVEFELPNHIWIDWMLFPEVSATGEVITVITTARDITERKRAEEELRRYRDRLEELVKERTAQLERTNEQLRLDIIKRERAEAALGGSERRYKALLEAIPDLMFVIARDGTVRSFSASNDAMLAVPRDAVIGTNIRDIGLAPQYLDAAFSSIERAITGGTIETFEYALKTPIGYRYFEDRIVALDEGSVLSIVRDITEKQRAERMESSIHRISETALSASNLEELFREIHQIVDGLMSAKDFYIALYDSENDLITFPYWFSEHEPAPPPRKPGKGLTEYVLRTRQPLLALPEVFEELARQGECESIGEPSVDWLGVPLKAHDKVIGVMAVQTYVEGLRYTETEKDVLVFISEQTAVAIDRKRAIDALAAEKEHLAVTLRSIGDGVITTDTRGRVALINKVAEALTGWTQREAKGKQLEEVFCVIDRKTREPLGNPVEQILMGGGATHLPSQVVLVSRDGQERLVADSASPIFDRDSRIIGTVLVFRDISLQRKIEDELLEARKLESISILAGGIAHDFNNILTAILGNISLSKVHFDPSDKIFERLSEAERATLRAKDLTQQLLTFSRGGAPIKQIASMRELLRETVSFALSGSNVRCDYAVSEDLWPVEIDPGQISQVINNLVINADQAMPEGGVIAVKAENVVLRDNTQVPLPAGRYIMVSIQDRGIGIPEEYLEKVFDPYFTTKQKGSGLGLTTAYSIVRRHDGYIRVQSRVGAGTTVYVYLPASEKMLEPAGSEKDRLQRGKGRILIMDDEEIIRETAGEMLEYLGYEIALAASGREAVDRYQQSVREGKLFDAVILDLTVPGGIGGKEALAMLRQIDPGVRAIVSSGYSNDPVMAEFREHGFCGVVAKPYKIEDLSQALQEAIEARGRR
ncbi:MAG: PAS domain S-box protein [Acidobacteriota bacterium]